MHSPPDDRQHTIFCDYPPLDTKNPSSYTPTTKKEDLINMELYREPS